MYADEDDHGVTAADEAGSDIDMLDGTGIEEEMNGLLSNLTGDMSVLAMALMLLQAKALYLRLHPDTKQGGDHCSEQAAKSADCFAEHAAKQSGIPARTISDRLKKAKDLSSLDPDAGSDAYGCTLANKLGLLVRIAALPAEVQRDIVGIYKAGAGAKAASAELAKAEKQLGIQPKPKKPKAKPEPETKIEGAPRAATAEVEQLKLLGALRERAFERLQAENTQLMAELKMLRPLQAENERLHEELAAAKAKPLRTKKPTAPVTTSSTPL